MKEVELTNAEAASLSQYFGFCSLPVLENQDLIKKDFFDLGGNFIGDEAYKKAFESWVEVSDICKALDSEGTGFGAEIQDYLRFKSGVPVSQGDFAIKIVAKP